MASTSVQSSTSQSAGSFIPDYEQMDFLQQVAQYSADLATGMVKWGQDTYNQVAALSDDVANRNITLAESAGGFAQAALDRYHAVFQPVEDQQRLESDIINSASYRSRAGGKATAAVEQGGEQGLKNAQQRLQDYGVSTTDPSSGFSRDMIMANKVGVGAVGAAAGNQAIENAENVGRALRADVIKTGQTYPAHALQAMQTGVSALNGATQAGALKTNAAGTLSKLADPYLQIAESLKLPPLGTGPSSTVSSGTSNTTDPSKDSSDKEQQDKGGSGKGDGSGGGGGGGNSGASSGGASSSGTGQYNSQTGEYDGSYGDMAGSYAASGQEIGGNYGWGNLANYGDVNGWYGQGGEGAQGTNWTGSSGTPYDVTGSGGFGGYGNIPQLPVSSYGGEMGAPDMSGNDAQYYSGSADSYGTDMDYAMGGPIDGQGGGMIPKSASPSGGAVQDDVQINAQPDEFVIPRDVALWKGQEFFQKMIAQSRSKRLGAPAHATRHRGR